MLLEICIPTWNRADRLATLLASIAAHRGDWDIGVLVSDNGSSDNTGAAVAPYCSEPWFRYQRHPENLGFDANIASLVRSGRGEYLWLQGDDDELDFKAIPALFATLQTKPALVWTNIQLRGAPSVSEQRGLLGRASSPLLEMVQRFGFFGCLGGLAHFVFRREHANPAAIGAFVGSNYLHAFMLASSYADEEVRLVHEVLTYVAPRTAEESSAYEARWEMQRGGAWDRAVLAQAACLDAFLARHPDLSPTLFRMYEGAHYPFQLLLLKSVGCLLFAGETVPEDVLVRLERLCDRIPHPSYRELAAATRVLASERPDQDAQTIWWQQYRVAGHSDWLAGAEQRSAAA